MQSTFYAPKCPFCTKINASLPQNFTKCHNIGVFLFNEIAFSVNYNIFHWRMNTVRFFFIPQTMNENLWNITILGLFTKTINIVVFFFYRVFVRLPSLIVFIYFVLFYSHKNFKSSWNLELFIKFIIWRGKICTSVAYLWKKCIAALIKFKVKLALFKSIVINNLQNLITSDDIEDNKWKIYFKASF